MMKIQTLRAHPGNRLGRPRTSLSRAMADAARRVADLERQFEQLKTYRDEYVRNSAAGRTAP